MFYNYVIIFACILTAYCKNLPENNTSIISTYAKVAHWGAVSTTTKKPQHEEGRSHNGQTLWTHRSDVNIVGGQNLKTSKPKVVYQYAVQSKSDVAPGIGEVQERFNPRPYFDYAHIPSKYQKTDSKPKPPPTSAPAPVPSPTFDSFPVFNKPSNPSVDLYTSQYSSYNPPNAGPVAPPEDKPDIAYPPNGPPPPGDTDVSPPVNPDAGYSYNPPDTPSAPSAPEGPPSYPPASAPDHGNHNEQIYYPPSEGGMHEVILDHPPPGWKEPESDMNGDMGHGMNGDMGHGMNGDMGHGVNGDMGHGVNGMNGGHDMAEQDLSPPPSQDYGGQFPHYLYSDQHAQGHDFDAYDFDHHHVYKEITTTTEAPEDERVNKGHYSYYYLGRKLWYIPLYFSVYFIIYVTVLILKSIARHKIQFKHEHFHRDNHGRALKNDILDEIHENVTTAINTTKKRFPYIVM